MSQYLSDLDTFYGALSFDFFSLILSQGNKTRCNFIEHCCYLHFIDHLLSLKCCSRYLKTYSNYLFLQRTSPPPQSRLTSL